MTITIKDLNEQAKFLRDTYGVRLKFFNTNNSLRVINYNAEEGYIFQTANEAWKWLMAAQDGMKMVHETLTA